MSMSTAEIIEPEYSIAAILEKVNNLVLDKATLREELDTANQKLTEKGEAFVFLTDKYNDNIDALLVRLNKLTFTVSELKQSSAQLYADKVNAETLLADMTIKFNALEEENAMILKSDEAISCGIDSRTNCTGCPECRA